jgi:glycosyltransferase involved in cell wall biosynthesis
VRIAIVTDAWVPQVNGVVRTLTVTVTQLLERGYEVELIVPDQFLTLPMPGYSQIRLAVAPRLGTRRSLRAFAPDVVHIVTEGPIGWSARRWCIQTGTPFTTAFHTRFPDYASVRTGLSADWFWPLMRRFHAPAQAVFVSTKRLRDELTERGIPGGRLWSRGIDPEIFQPQGTRHPALDRLSGPILLSVGRVSYEKNLEAFLDADVEGTKVVVGDGPALVDLKQRYPRAIFLGALHGADLASAYRAADVFVFPSLTDTFGLVMIEALACGVPVAGFPVLGPLDIVGEDGRGAEGELHEPVGALDKNLSVAIRSALDVSRSAAARYGQTFDWDRCTDQFIAGLRHACGETGDADHAGRESVTLHA